MAEGIGISSFAGGANNFLAPDRLGDKFARVMRDVSIDNGAMVSAPGDLSVSAETPLDLGHYGETNRSAAKQFGRWYWSINDAGEAPYYGGDDYPPGIPYPAAPPTMAKAFDASSGLTAGTYRYCVTCLNKDGWESAPGDTTGDEWYNKIVLPDKKAPALIQVAGNGTTATATLKDGEEHTFVVGDKVVIAGTADYDDTVALAAVTDDTLSWASILTTTESGLSATATLVPSKVMVTLPAVPAGTTAVKLFRTVKEGADYYLVATIAAAQALSPYEDKLSDIDLLFNEAMESLYYLPPPDGGKYLTESGGAFFLAVEDKLYFSEIGNCHAWNPSNWIGFDDDITGVSIEFQGLLVFTANRVYRVTGCDALTIAKQEIPTRQGCSNWRTIATLSNAPLWMSNDGICMWDGQGVKLLSFQRWKFASAPAFCFAANDRYYLVGDSGTAVFDLRAGGVFYEITLYADYAWYDTDLDAVFYRRDGEYYQLEGGSRRRTVIYRSGLLGGNMALTEFRKLRISSDCTVEFVLRDHLGREIDSGTIGNGDTSERWLKSGHPARGADLELRFSGTVREFALTGWQTKN